MFSIIIALYNKRHFIENCLRSVYSQTFHDYEIILVDDGSTDGGMEIVRNFINKTNWNRVENGSINHLPAIRLISQKNSGVSTARNNGVKAAKTDYIAFLDADDWWEPDYLEAMKNLIEKYPEAGIYGCGYYLVKNGKKRVAPIGIDSNFSDGSINYFRVYGKNLCMPLWTGATVIKKSIFEYEKGFNPQIHLGEDFDLWVRIALKYPVFYLNKPLAIYSQDVEPLSRAIGKLHRPENHVLWNISYLADEEKVNNDLKIVLDKLRVYSLFPYFLQRSTRNMARTELSKVNWKVIPPKEITKYKSPVLILRLIQIFRKLGSRTKKLIISSLHAD